jgi:hypothetical protein
VLVKSQRTLLSNAEGSHKVVFMTLLDEIREDTRDLYTGARNASETRIQKVLWCAATITTCFLLYSVLRLYLLRELLAAEIMTCFGLAMLGLIAAILYILGPMGGRQLALEEAKSPGNGFPEKEARVRAN